MWLVLLAFSGASVYADGIGTPQYRYVHPPKFLKNSNLPPTPGFATKSLSSTGRSIPVYTEDIQAGVSFSHGAFGFPLGQRAISIRIQPVSRYPALPAGPLDLDGNVYRFTYKFVPSGRVPGRSLKPVLIAMEAPHTPMEALAFDSGHWHVLCGRSSLIITPSSADCYSRNLSSYVALSYKPFGKSGRPSKPTHRRTAITPDIVVGIVLAVALTVLVIFLVYVRSRGSRRQ